MEEQKQGQDWWDRLVHQVRTKSTKAQPVQSWAEWARALVRRTILRSDGK